MNSPYLNLAQIDDGYQALFAFRISHRFADDWLKMKWGFNASILLEEAVDRVKLFVEAQATSEMDFRAGIVPNRTLALRGINFPEHGLQMAVIGKTIGTNKEDAYQAACHYAREIQSIFPHDFIITAGDEADFHKLCGDEILNNNSSVAQILRAIVVMPSAYGNHYVTGLWQSSMRSNEQIWRALGAMPEETMFNIMIQPSALLDGDRQILLDIKKKISEHDKDGGVPITYKPWVEKFLNRRLLVWKKYFLLQMHLVSTGTLDENLFRSIGTAVTRDSNEFALPGYFVRRPEMPADEKSWRANILSLDFIPSFSRFDDLADIDEVSSIFRIPYQPETGLPGAVFIDAVKKPTNSTENEE